MWLNLIIITERRQALPADLRTVTSWLILKGVTAQEKASLASVVSVNSAIMHGTPCFTGTRVPVQTLLDYIEDGDTIDKFLSDFATVKRTQVVGFLELAKEQLIECVSS